MKKISWRLFGLILALSFCGCATPGRNLVAGSLVGGGAGFAVGLGSKPRQTYSAVGALSGAGIGFIASYFLNKHFMARDRRVRQETLLGLDAKGVDIGERKKSCELILTPLHP